MPSELDFRAVCEFIDDQGNEAWLPVIEYIAEQHELPLLGWVRWMDGGNVLFKRENLVIKIVPPNWVHQGHGEIDALSNLNVDLGLDVPRLLANGHIDGWAYLVLTWLDGDCLSSIWPDLQPSSKRQIVKQVGQLCKALHKMPVKTEARQPIDWQLYQVELIAKCVARHQRAGISAKLVDQVIPFIHETQRRFDDYFFDATQILIHMDLHPGNLMVREDDRHDRLSGVLDFGDSIVGCSRLLELATPIIFLCQGDVTLVRQLLDSYELLNPMEPLEFQTKLMAVVLLRPDCDLNFVMQQVPVTGPRDTWGQIAEQLFPLEH